MKRFRSNVVISSIGAIIAIVLMAVAIYFAGERVYFTSKNADVMNSTAPSEIRKATIKTNNGEFLLDAKDIIAQATKLLGADYLKGAKGFEIQNSMPKYNSRTGKWVTRSAQVIKQAVVEGGGYVNGIDCSGLVLWSVTSAVQESQKVMNHLASINFDKSKGYTRNFILNKPIPYDSLWWLVDKNGQPWNETTYWVLRNNKWVEKTDKRGNNLASTANLTFLNQGINILKKSDFIDTDYRYYNYKDKDGNIKVLPAGTIIVTYGNLLNDDYDNHCWIYLGELGDSVDDVIAALRDKYGIENAEQYRDNIKDYGDCRHWRIESAGGNERKVIIDNGDPNYGEQTSVSGKTKAIGPVWAFQIANDTIIPGAYNLSIEKTDIDGNALNADNIASIFNVKLNKNVLTGTSENSKMKYENIAINSIEDDTIVITETEAPNGYSKLADKLTIKVSKNIENNQYVASISSVKLGSETLTAENGVYENDKVRVEMSNGYIQVKVKNPYIDLALKKTIEAVKHSGQENYVAVEQSNGFNTDRHGDETAPADSKWSITGVENLGQIDSTTNKMTTNALYNMKKTPVNVTIGDNVKYTIKIFNEGQVKAKAGEIIDYIPTGLTVTSVKYGTSDSDIPYTCNNNVLKVDLSGEGVRFINPVNNNTLDYDYITVYCNVDATAEGILTNIAEISKYVTEIEEVDNDIDSTPNNWENPIDNTHGSNTRVDKSDRKWKNYASEGAETAITGNSWSKTFLAQDSGVNGNKGDDDDFDKLMVIKGEYSLEVNKIDTLSNPIPLGENGTNKFTATVNETTLQGQNESDIISYKVRNEGNTEINSVLKIDANNCDTVDTVIIEEVTAPDGYKKFDYKIKLEVNKYERSQGQYGVYVNKVILLNSDGTVYQTVDRDHNTPISMADEIYFEGGHVRFENGKISIYVINEMIDLALKKRITEVGHVAVKTPEFNTTREGESNGEPSINWETIENEPEKWGIYDIESLGYMDYTTNKRITNPQYKMKKTPVQVSKGDVITYKIYVINEGEVKAKAGEIIDYIPTGLRVDSVYYGRSNVDMTGKYVYTPATNVLTINLSGEDIALIDKIDRDNRTLHYDYVTVYCTVNDDATGVLTNIAEISKYITEDGEVDNDIDSTPNDWKNPNDNNHENNITTDKSTQAWKNYTSEGTESFVNKNRWSKLFLAQDSGLNGFKGDDDDFEKVVVLEGQYGVNIQKVSSTDEATTLQGVKFKGYSAVVDLNGTEVAGSRVNFETPREGDTALDYIVTGENGIVEVANKKINRENVNIYDKYAITEIDVGDNEGYSKLNTEFDLYVKKDYDEDTEKCKIAYWSILKSGETDWANNLNADINATNRIVCGNGSLVINENGKTFVITASRDENGLITIKVPNVPDRQVGLNLKKFDKDTGNRITGGVYGIVQVEPSTSLSERMRNLNVEDTNAEYGITVSTGLSTDADTNVKYWIYERKAPEGYDNILENTKYYIEVTGKVHTTTSGETVSYEIVDSGADKYSFKIFKLNETTGEYEEVASTDDIYTYVELGLSSDKRTFELSIKDKETEHPIDLALKKVITEINNVEVKAENGFNQDYDRLTTGDDKIRIDVTPLNNGENDAKYYLNKTPILVNQGDKVKYQLRIYNEAEVPATASKIKDYLPNGLRLVDVYYSNSNSGLTVREAYECNNTTKLVSGTDYVYDETNNVVTISKLSDLIPAYNKTESKIYYDYVVVECEVKENATGMLTNVSEISEYTVPGETAGTTKTIEQDRDSTRGNWKNPNDYITENNDTTNKETDKWIDYAGREGNAIEKGVIKTYPGQEDDDDFEKIMVAPIMKWRVRKVDAMVPTNKKPIEGARFNINSQTTDFNLLTNADGYVKDNADDSTKQFDIDINQNLGEFFTIEETVSAENYIKLNGQLLVTVNKQENSHTHLYDKLLSYDIVQRYDDSLSNSNGLRGLSLHKIVYIENLADGGESTETFIAKDVQGNNVNVVITVKRLNGNYTMDFEIENVIESSKYNWKVKKTLEDGTTPIPEITFNIKGNVSSFGYFSCPATTNADGEINLSEIPSNEFFTAFENFEGFEINNTNYNTIDSFTLKEKPDVNSIYYTITDEIKFYVKKEYNETTNKFGVKGVSFTESENDADYQTSITKQVHLSNSEEVPVTITVNNNEIEVKVVNKPKAGKYNLKVIKVDEKGNPLKTPQSGFKLNDNSEVLTNAQTGEATLLTEVPITINNRETNDVYNLTETTVPTGYIGLDSSAPIRIEVIKTAISEDGLDVKFVAFTGYHNNRIVYPDSDDVYLSAKLTDGTIVKLDISIENNTITIKVPNQPKKGGYEVYLDKVDENGSVCGAEFQVTETDSNPNVEPNGAADEDELYNGDTIVNPAEPDGEEMKIIEKEIVQSTVGTPDTFTITEAKGPDGYYKLSEPINIEVVKTENNSNYSVSSFKVNGTVVQTELTIEHLAVKDPTTNEVVSGKEAKLIANVVGNNVLKIKVTNIKKDGAYNIKLDKVSYNENTHNYDSISGAKFTVTEIGGTESSNSDITSPIEPNGGPVEFINRVITEGNYTKTDILQIEEVSMAGNYYKLAEPFVITVVKEFTGDGYTAAAYFIKSGAYSETDSENGEFGELIVDVNHPTSSDSGDLDGRIEVPLEGTDAKAYIICKFDENNTLLLQVQNNPFADGSYGIEILKQDENGEPLTTAQAGFTLNSNPEVKTSTANGVAKLLESKAITTANVDTPDEYTITETSIPTGFIGLAQPITVKVYKENRNGTLQVRCAEFSVEGAFIRVFEDTENAFLNAKLTDGSNTKIDLDINNGKIILTIKNKHVLGGYNILLDKVNEKGESISGAEFTVVETDRNTNVEGDVITSPAKPTGSPIQIISKNIANDTYSTADTYLISETKAPNGFYKLSEPIKLEVQKALTETGYKVSKVVINNDYELTSGDVTISGIKLADTNLTAKVKVSLNENVINVVVEDVEITGSYNFTITKKDAETDKVIEDETTTFDVNVYSKLTDTVLSDKVTLKDVNFNTINTKGITAKTNGVAKIENIAITANEVTSGTYYFEVIETKAPDKYTEIKYRVVVPVTFKLENGKYVAVHENSKAFALVEEDGNVVKKELRAMATKETECVSTSQTDVTINVNVPNKKKEFDFALRKFISKVNDKALEGEESREPKVDVSTLINGDPKKNGEKTATYTHTKEPKLVNPTDVVEYTLRIYNECELDGYAKFIIDDVPAEVTMVAPTYDGNGKATNQNAEYRWVMYKELTDASKASEAQGAILRYNDKLYVETKVAEEAVMIGTDYLSKEQGEARMSSEDTENPSLLKAFDGKNLNYKDIKVQFQVKKVKDKDLIITNYAQISEQEYKDGTVIPDRDSTPNKWIDNEDDQDVEHIRVTWFDLALYKWVSSAIVTENGKTKEYPSGHTATDKDKIVNVTIAKDKLKSTVVKFNWRIRVENQGVIAGYAKELKDHIPEGLKFEEADNLKFGWKLQEDGTITTDYLKNTLLQPGETAEVSVILTWVNNENNLGKKVNSAEISKDENKYGVPDIDSTPDNYTGSPVEDDEDWDEVRLNLRTGNGVEIAYVLIGTVLLAVVAGGVFGIKKFVLNGR